MSSRAGQESTPRFSLVCKIAHSRYGTVVASQLLSSQTRWNPLGVIKDTVSLLAWFQTPVTQLETRLRKVDSKTMKRCCDLHLAPGSTPKNKTERYDVMIQRFRARLLYLLSCSNVDFAREYVTLLPQGLSFPLLPEAQLVEALLRTEYGDVISGTLTSLPSAEIVKENNRRTRRKKYNAAVFNTHEIREEYIQSWPQVTPKDITVQRVSRSHMD